MSRKIFIIDFTRRVGLYLVAGLAVSNTVFLAFVGRSLGRSYSEAFNILMFTEETALRQTLEIDAVLVALVGVLVYFAALLMSHRISGPVYRFERTAEAVARGDFPGSVRLREKDELKGVAREFDGAVSAMRDRISRVEKTARDLEEIAAILKRTGPGADDKGLRLLLEKKSGELKALVDFFETEG